MNAPRPDPVRRVSRIASAFLLVAACAVVLAIAILIGAAYVRQRRAAEAERAAAPADVAPELRLEDFVPVRNTAIFRARLVNDDDRDAPWASSYKRLGPFRNVLFANSETGESKWLLPDDDHEVVDFRDLPDDWRADRPPPRVTVALVKPRSDRSRLVGGDLLLLTIAGGHVVKVADDVRVLAATSIVDDTTVAMVYERQRHFYMAQYSVDGLAKRAERELAIPQLN